MTMQDMVMVVTIAMFARVVMSLYLVWAAAMSSLPNWFKGFAIVAALIIFATSVITVFGGNPQMEVSHMVMLKVISNNLSQTVICAICASLIWLNERS